MAMAAPGQNDASRLAASGKRSPTPAYLDPGRLSPSGTAQQVGNQQLAPGANPAPWCESAAALSRKMPRGVPCRVPTGSGARLAPGHLAPPPED